MDQTASRGDEPCVLQRLVGAETECDILRICEASIAALPAVDDTVVYLFDPSEDCLEPTGSSNAISDPSPTAVAAFETGEPQSARESVDTEIDLAYPLGEAGVVSLRVDELTSADREHLCRLTIVTGGCLEHTRTHAQLEERFHRIAEQNQELSQFARTVSHDLNSPLSVIYGRIELAVSEPSNAEMHLQAAQNAAQRVDSLITDHLQRIETLDDASETEVVSIQAVAIQAWRIIDPSTARLQIEPRLEDVEANPTRLQQLFENLIRNAIEHGSEESVGLGSARDAAKDPHAVFDATRESVTVTIKPTADGFAVCDDGPGIPVDEREDVFESGYTTTNSGSGLGLYIVGEIVEAHGWEIAVTASERGGARFEITTE